MTTQWVNKGRHAVYARTEQAFPALDLFKEQKKSGRATVEANAVTINVPELGAPVPLDFNTWLPFSAPHYHISSDPKDYVITPVIVMPSDLPNRNGVAFPLRELVRFHPHLGQQAYKTWKGKPTFREHANKDIEKAHGVIADSFLRPLHGWAGGKIWKVLLLLAFDRSKHPELANNILAGDENAYSMGAWVATYSCSYCGQEVGKGCTHLREKQNDFYELDGKLVHKNCVGIEGFECSSVATPAYISAISDDVKELR